VTSSWSCCFVCLAGRLATRGNSEHRNLKSQKGTAKHNPATEPRVHDQTYDRRRRMPRHCQSPQDRHRCGLGRNNKELKTLLLLKVDRKDWPHGTQDVAVQRFASSTFFACSMLCLGLVDTSCEFSGYTMEETLIRVTSGLAPRDGLGQD
jgi:hypothetical protein